jgi:hypothetical protein
MIMLNSKSVNISTLDINSKILDTLFTHERVEYNVFLLDEPLKANRDEVLVRFSVNRWRGIYLAVFS